MYANWATAHQTGIEIIDAENLQFYRCFEDLVKALSRANSCSAADFHEDIEHILQRLTNYVSTLHVLEGMLLEQAKYPYLADHKALHAVFKEILSTLSEKHRRGVATQQIAKELQTALNYWMLEHLAKVDQQSTPYLKRVVKQGRFK